MPNKFASKLRSLICFQGVLLLVGNYSSLYQRDFFNLVPPPPPRVEIKPIIREPLLSEILILKGTIIGGAGLSSLAVIEDRQAKSENVYQEGGEIKGARIVKIEGNQISLLDKEGKEVILYLSSASAAGIPSGRPMVGPVIGAEVGRDASVAFSQPVTIGNEASASTSVSLADITRQVTQNPAELSNLKATPVVSGGKVTGYRVKNITSGSLAARYGIRNGDIVTSVNGIALTSLSRASSIYSSVKAGSTVTVQIIRSGSPVTLSFNLTK